MTEQEPLDPIEVIKARPKDTGYWVQFFVGVAMLAGMLWIDVESGGSTMPDYLYGIPPVIMLGVTPSQLVEIVQALLRTKR